MSRDLVLLRDIVESIDAIMEFTAEGYESFQKDRRTQFAVIRAFEVMGEAAKLVSQSTRARFPEVAWSQMAWTRDKLIHDYPGVDLDVLWRTVAGILPDLRAGCSRSSRKARSDALRRCAHPILGSVMTTA